MEWSLKFTCRGDVLRCWGVQWDPKTRILCGSEPHITESNKGDAHEPYRILLNESLQYVSMYIYVYIKHPDFPLSLSIYIHIYMWPVSYICTLYNIYNHNISYTIYVLFLNYKVHLAGSTTVHALPCASCAWMSCARVCAKLLRELRRFS